MDQPVIIQGGMGIGVSSWRLAKEVSKTGQLGVVSGTAVSTILIRRLQLGDPDGTVRRALSFFPFQTTSKSVLDRYFIDSGKTKDKPFALSPLYTLKPDFELLRLTALASFVEVFLAKEGHSGLVGINLLEKIQLSNLAVIYGAMLAEVDYLLMGAGIPREIPGVLDLFAEQKPASIKVVLAPHSKEANLRVEFDPSVVFPFELNIRLKRPRFLAIVSSAVLAQHLLSKATGQVDGFIIEGPTAGGHNAPPRGPLHLNEIGEPIYGPKDGVNFEQLNQMKILYWLAGGFGSPEKLREAKSKGAVGIQVGTPFAFCDESGLTEEIKRSVISRWTTEKEQHVFTDPNASPTGFPFKVVPLEGSISEKEIYENRKRRCDVGYLRQVFVTENEETNYICPAEPAANYVKKGGEEQDCIGRKCLCNALLANVGLGQIQQDGYDELPLLTAGDDLSSLKNYVPLGTNSFSAKQVISYLLQ